MWTVENGVTSDRQVHEGTCVDNRTASCRTHCWKRISWTTYNPARPKYCMPRLTLALPTVLITRTQPRCRVPFDTPGPVTLSRIKKSPYEERWRSPGGQCNEGGV